MLGVSKEETVNISWTEICQQVKERFDIEKTCGDLTAEISSYWFFSFYLLTFKEIWNEVPCKQTNKQKNLSSLSI